MNEELDRKSENSAADGDVCLEKAEADLSKAAAELKHAERDVEKAEEEVREAEEHNRHREIEVKVDGQKKLVAAGTYLVSVFKTKVGVAADRELDVIKDGVLTPLDDNAEIKIHECEVFVSHVRTGGSS